MANINIFIPFHTFDNIYTDFLMQKEIINEQTYKLNNFLYEREADFNLNLDEVLIEMKITTCFKLLTKLEASLVIFNKNIFQKIGRSNDFKRNYYLKLRENKKSTDHSDYSRDEIISSIRYTFLHNNENNAENFYGGSSHLGEYFKFRNWYAHGRHWNDTTKLEPDSLRTLCNQFNTLVFNHT
jgi:hypothetical protein